MMHHRGSALLKALVWLVVLAAIGVGVYVGTRPKKEGPTYRTAVIERGDIVQAVTATGQLNPVTNVQVGSQISGIITNLVVDYNSQVTKGQIVAQLDAATYSASVHQAEGDLSNSLASLELAQLDANRSAELLKAHLIPQADNDKAQATLHQAQAQVKIKRASLEKSQVDLDRCTIYAPVDGVVISRNVDVGQTVAASLSAPTIYVIANDLSKMQIDANVSEADVGGVEVSQAVTFTVDAFPYRTFRGRVKQIRNSPITNQNVISYDTVIEVSNDDLKLKPGMTANVSIITAQRENAVKISNAALRFRMPGVTNTPVSSMASAARSGGSGPRGGGDRSGGLGSRSGGGPRLTTRTVYLLSSTNQAEGVLAEPQPQQIKTGISDGISTEVIEGLTGGETVVTGMSVGASSTTTATTTPGSPAGNPFGGGPRRF
jgi:HlyD family secretion protein